MSARSRRGMCAHEKKKLHDDACKIVTAGLSPLIVITRRKWQCRCYHLRNHVRAETPSGRGIARINPGRITLLLKTKRNDMVQAKYYRKMQQFLDYLPKT